MLSVENLSHYYKDGNQTRYVLDGINADFEKGKFYTIVGQSGSGKTTLLSLIGGLEKIKEGHVYLDNKDINQIDESIYRSSKIGIIFQAYNLVSYLSAVDNVLVAMDITQNEMPEDKKSVAYNLLAYIGIDKNKADRNVKSLSGGEQQRVAIARALACDVDYILADEPTGNLDEKTEKEFIKIFQKLAHEDNKCVICVTHSSDVASVSDIILRLKKGKITNE